METTTSPESLADVLSEEELAKEIADLESKLKEYKEALSKKAPASKTAPSAPSVTPVEPPSYDADTESAYDEYSPTDPSYDTEEGYSPEDSYSPDSPDGYYAADSTELRDFRAEALEFINNLSRRDQERAIDRFGGFKPFAALSGVLRLFRLRNQAAALDTVDNRLSAGAIGTTIGRIRGWFDRVGQRSISENEELTLDDNLERAGVFNRNPWWKKCLKIGAKLFGGLGVAGSMVLTGGVGAATALLWAGGTKEAFDSAGQTIEQIGWGRRRAHAELNSQAGVSELVDHLKLRVVDAADPITEEEYITIVKNIVARESELMDTQCQSITGEKKWQAGRSIATSVLTLGTGLFAGVPLGNLNYDTDNTALAESMRAAAGTPGARVMDEAHRGFWNIMHGGQFGYGHENVLSAVKDSINGVTPSGQEYDKIQNIINYLNNTVHGKFGTFGLETTGVYGQTAHELGQGLALADKLKLGSALAYLIAEPLRHIKAKEGDEAYTSYDSPSTGYGSGRDSGPHYGPDDSAYSADDAYESGRDRSSDSDSKEVESGSVEEERMAIDRYIKSLKISAKSEKKYAKEPATKAEAYSKDLDEKLKELPPMKSECKLAICVPAVYSEHETIRGYLDSLLDQQDQDSEALDPNLFEVNVFVNGPAAKVTEIDQTVSIINDFKKEHPELTINVLTGAYDPRKNIGYYRKLVTDSALLRSRERTAQAGSLYLVSHDADIRIRDKNYLSSIITRMDASPDTKVMAGRVDYNEEDKKKYPIVWASRRLWQYLDMFRTESRYGNIPEKAAGANTVIRAESYARAKGYRISDKVAEDLALVEGIIRTNKNLYESNRKEIIKSFPNRVEISPRRDINSIKEGKGLDAGYLDFDNNDTARERTESSDDAVANIQPKNESEFLKQLEVEANAQMNSLFMKVFYDLCDHSPEMIGARESGIKNGDPKLNEIQDRLYDAGIGTKADLRAREIFNKACGYLGIGDMEIQSVPTRSIKYGTKQNKYTVKIKDWSKLRDSLIEKTE